MTTRITAAIAAPTIPTQLNVKCVFAALALNSDTSIWLTGDTRVEFLQKITFVAGAMSTTSALKQNTRGKYRSSDFVVTSNPQSAV